MDSRKKIIEDIRQKKYGIGHKTDKESQKIIDGMKDRLNRMLEKLSEDLYTTDTHFVLELIQNADDNKYEEGVRPFLKFIVDQDKILLQNNEKGFREEHVDALCDAGKTTKGRSKDLGYIGEKGIGFKSVFRISDEPQVFSNGFHFKFKRKDPNDKLGFVIPYWIEDIPEYVDLDKTNIVLPLKEGVKSELSKFQEVEPTLLLFLRRLKVIQINNRLKDERYRLVKKIKNGMVEIKNPEGKEYWKLVKKIIDVPDSLDEEKRKDVEQTEIILAFPLKSNGAANTQTKQKVFAYLPTQSYGFKFIIQADFLLSANREDIHKDKEWNEFLRDEISELFLESVEEFKKDKNLKKQYYNYIPLSKEITDDFFSDIVDQIHDDLEEYDCILAESGNWKKPSRLISADDKIRDLFENEYLRQHFDKEYVSSEIEINKSILNALNIPEFGFDHLVKLLKDKSWLEKKDDDWFTKLFLYIKEQELEEEQIKRLKELNILRLENNKLVSISEEKVFFPLQKKGGYSFENEISVVKKELLETNEKESKKEIKGFLKNLGVQNTNPSEIIDEHILPVYENDDDDSNWKSKDNETLLGYTRYIKDNIDKYKKEHEEDEKPLARIKKNLVLRVDKDNEKSSYKSPNKIYLPNTYGNENKLEFLFDRFEVDFLNDCYINEYFGSENNDSPMKDNDKIKEWKEFLLTIGVNEVPRVEKHKVECKRKYTHTNCQIQDELGIKRDERVETSRGHKHEIEDRRLSEEFKNLLKSLDPVKLDISEIEEDFNEGTIAPRLNQAFKNEGIGISEKAELVRENGIWQITNNEEEYLIERKNKLLKIYKPIDLEKSKIIIEILDNYWDDVYSKYVSMNYSWFYYDPRNKKLPSTFIRDLRKYIRLPTTQNTLAKADELFLNKNEIKALLGNTVQYLDSEIENEELIEKININAEANVKNTLDYLKQLVNQNCEEKEKFRNLYTFLNEHFEDTSSDISIKKQFSKHSLIFVPKTKKKYYKLEEVLWNDASDVFEENKIYLENHYGNLKKFFVDKLDVSKKPLPKDYADTLITISKKDQISEEDREIIKRIYEELDHNLDSDKVVETIDEKDWWEDFIQKEIFLTNKNEFWANDGNIFIKDDSQLSELFSMNDDIAFLWLPHGYHPDKIKNFINKCSIRYLSENCELTPMIGDTKTDKNEELTDYIQNIIPFIFRYLYWKEHSRYEKLKEKKELEKLPLIEVYIADDLKVKYEVNYKPNLWDSIYETTKKNCVLDGNKLYISQNRETSNFDIPIEISKIFGEIKGLEDFLLLLNEVEDYYKREEIMDARDINRLPPKEQEYLFEKGSKRSDEKSKSEFDNEISESDIESEFMDSGSDDDSPASVERRSERSKDHEKTPHPIYDPSELKIEGQTITIKTEPDEKTRDQDSETEISSSDSFGDTIGGSQSYLEKIDKLGMWVTRQYELNRIEKNYECENPEDYVFDIHNEELYSEAKVDDTAGPVLKELEESGLPELYPGFDILVVNPKSNEADRLIELKSSRTNSRTLEITWNEWKTARDPGFRDSYYLYNVGNLGKDSRSTPYLKEISNPFQLLNAKTKEKKEVKRTVKIDVNSFKKEGEIKKTKLTIAETEK